MNSAYLLLGSNMGNSQEKLLTAIKNIEDNIGTVKRRSGIYRTAAWGNTNQPDFLNQVIITETKFTVVEILHEILAIEKKMGRIRTIKNAPRIIDIDILFFNREIISAKHLTIPHPEIPNRRFVLVPLNELSPNLKHPVLNKSIHRLLDECSDPLDVKKF